MKNSEICLNSACTLLKNACMKCIHAYIKARTTWCPQGRTLPMYSRAHYEGDRASVDQEREQRQGPEFSFEEREVLGMSPSLFLLFLKQRSLPPEESAFSVIFFSLLASSKGGDGIYCNVCFGFIRNWPP